MDLMIHGFRQPVSHLLLPEKFTYPFSYTPHPLCVLAAEEVKTYLAGRGEWQEELSAGKMFGVLVVQLPPEEGGVGYLAAFSGNLAGSNCHPYFVPPVYDLLRPQGFFKVEEAQISAINTRIGELERAEAYLAAKEHLRAETEQVAAMLNTAKADLKAAKEARAARRQSASPLSEEEQAALVRESQHRKAAYKRLEREGKARVENAQAEVSRWEGEVARLKEERKERSAALQQKLFRQFRMLNARGEVRDLCDIFRQTVHKLPPAGAGECALPKMLQYAYLHGLKPLAMAEFWWGNSPKNEVRRHGYHYPSCKGKCEPILQHMLQGLSVEDNPLLPDRGREAALEVVYEDEWLAVVNKPAGMLSVPGKEEGIDSVYARMKEKYPAATGPLVVHRLDMATSGLLLVAKTKEVHRLLQQQFEDRSIYKRYVALLDGEVHRADEGVIDLPLMPDWFDRPRQRVDEAQGKAALTEYRVVERGGGRTRILFHPLTGRTHQLRVHAAHPQGLNCPILGDELYGRKADRLYLHAEYLEFRHPVHGDAVCVLKEADF